MELYHFGCIWGVQMLNISLLARICSPRPPSRTGSDKSMNLVAIPPYQIMIMDQSSDPNLRQNSWRMHCPTRNRAKKWQPNSLEDEDKHDSGSDPAPKTLISTDQQSPPFLKAVPQTSDIVWWASKFGSWSTTQGRCERCLSRATKGFPKKNHEDWKDSVPNSRRSLD